MTAMRNPFTPRETDGRSKLYSTNQLAQAAGVTPRTVRFYESQGLLKPQRAGITRVYSYGDKARLSLILRGKRLGFSLQEIGEYLDLYAADPDHTEQIKHVLSKTQERISVLESKLKDLQETLAELRQIEDAAVTRLKTKGIDPGQTPPKKSARRQG